MSTTARHVYVSGYVQGVGFRHHTKVVARELGLAGWVRNLNDGRVEVWAEGPTDAVESLVAWLRRGAPGGHVDSLTVEPEPPAGHAQFKVRFD
jgi:acylphosphatase